MTDQLVDQLQRSLGAAYTIERELGGGGMSRVFVAEEPALRRRIVVKVLPPELAAEVASERFKREILLSARLQHPHIVPLISSGDSNGLPYYTMPYVDGESLRDRLGRGAMPVSECARLMREIASALDHAHKKGIVHRDIKPENILLSGGVALVTDFGVAKAVIASATSPGPLTSVGISVGTPAYMSPEQISADPQVDYRADLYSFGVVAYEMLAGLSPFAGKTSRELMSAHLVSPPEPLARHRADTPPALADLIVRCLAKDPDERPASASEIIRTLDTIAVRTPVPAPVNARIGAGSRRITIGLSLALCAVLAVGVLWFTRKQPKNIPPSRLLVIPFENLTGDSTLNYVGRLASDQITSMVAQLGSASVVSSNVVLSAIRESSRPNAEELAQLAKTQHADQVVVGTFTRRGDSLVFNARVTDAVTGNIVHAFDPAAGVATDPGSGPTQLGDHLLGFLGGGAIAGLPHHGFRAPNAAAFRDFNKAQDLLFVQDKPREARPYLESAIAHDSGFVRAYLMLYGAYKQVDRALAESLLARVERLPQRLTPGEQALLDYERAESRGDLPGQLDGQQRLAALDSSLGALMAVGSLGMALARSDVAIPAFQSARARAGVLGDAKYELDATYGLARSYHVTATHDQELRVLQETRRKYPHSKLLPGTQLRAYAALKRGREALSLADSILGSSAADPAGDVLVFVGWGGWEFRAHGDTTTAARLFEMSRRWMSSHPESSPSPLRRYREALVLFASRMYDSAAVRLGPYERDPSQPDAPTLIVLSRLAGGDRHRATLFADSLGRLPSPSGATTMSRAAVISALGDRAAAVALLRQANATGANMQSWHSSALLEPLFDYPPFVELTSAKR